MVCINMNKLRGPFALALLFTLSGALFAQDQPPANSAKVVTVQGFPSLKPIHPGTLFTVAVQVKVQEGWHVNAHQGLPEFFIPADLSLDAGAPASLVSPVRYPVG